jgi:hypothetical protein
MIARSGVLVYLEALMEVIAQADRAEAPRVYCRELMMQLRARA